MNNKILSIFIIIGVIGAGYLYYHFSFKPNKIIEEKARIEELKKSEEEKIIKKEVSLEKIELKNEELTTKQKVNNLKEKNTSYAFFILDNIGNFSFKNENNKLELYFFNDKIGSFDLVEESELSIKEVISNKNYVFIKVGEKKYLYNLKTKKIDNIDIKLDIKYVKAGIDNLEFLFKTNVGIFIYSRESGETQYFNYFKDFVYYKEGYLGIINFDEETKLKNLGFKNEDKNLIVFYNPKTKEKSIKYKTALKLQKIYKTGEKIFFEDEAGEKYELKNID